MVEKSGNDHTKVAPTAWGVAYLRTFTDIPLTKEFFGELDRRAQAQGGVNTAGIRNKDKLAPQLEARYKLVDKLLYEFGLDQIIELAAGLAPRGVNFARADAGLAFVELDLPDVIREKQAVISSLGIEVPSNLSLVPGDVLNAADIMRAMANFSKDKPVAIMNEGLLRYLTFPEKTLVAKNVRAMLEQFGGVWITPDISLRAAMAREDEVASGHMQSLASRTGIDLSQNVFDSPEQAKEFFENLGFNVERHGFLEVSDQLVSPARLNMSPEAVTRLNDQCVAFVMKLAK